MSFTRIARRGWAAIAWTLLAGTIATAMASGSSGSPVASAARTPVYFSEFGGDYYFERLRQRPHAIHGGSDFGWYAIRWRHWGGALAYGTGRAYYVNKDQVPYRRETWRAAFRMGKRAACHGRLVYREMLVVNGPGRDRHIPRHWRFPYPCSNASL